MLSNDKHIRAKGFTSNDACALGTKWPQYGAVRRSGAAFHGRTTPWDKRRRAAPDAAMGFTRPDMFPEGSYALRVDGEITTVLHEPPVDSPLAAVRAADRGWK